MTGQLFANALIFGSIYALVGVGFSLIFRVTGFFHFTYGLSFSLGAYVAFAFYRWYEFPFLLASFMSMILAGVFGFLFDLTLFGPLRKRRASTLASLIASMGFYVLGQNLLSLTFGDGSLSIRSSQLALSIEILGAFVTLPQLLIMASAIVLISATSIWLSKTKLGREVRCVANDRELAEIAGINSTRIVSVVIVVGSMLGGLSGILSVLDRDLVPTMGMKILLMGIVAMIVGGKESIVGVAAGAVFIGLVQNMSILFIPSAWQDALVFLILIAFLLFRPQGFWGQPLRESSV